MEHLILLLPTMVIGLGGFFLIRNNQVFKFRCLVNELCYQYSIKTGIDGYKKFMDRLPSYGTMVHSFKSLKLETYFTDDEINELLLKNHVA